MQFALFELKVAEIELLTSDKTQSSGLIFLDIYSFF